MSIRVLIAGSGLGGLTLAQSLRRAGVDVLVFERDASPWDRAQGYRLHLDSDALNAVEEVLPPDLYQAFVASAYRTAPFTTILGTDLSVIKRIPTDAEHDQAVWPDTDQAPGHANVDRATLRSILLGGLDDVVQFGKQLERYSATAGGRVVAHFADGTTIEGDVLVGADGIRSAVRRQRFRASEAVDAGITAIYGRLPLEVARPLVPAETLSDIFTIATDERKVFLGLGAVDPASTGAVAGQGGYVVCIVGGRHEYFPSRAELRAATSEQLGEIAVDTIGLWPDRARDVVRAGDPAAFFLVEMSTSVPHPLDEPVNVTLLGDAVHAMTPTLGRGANVAMRDGALLGRALRDVAAGVTPLVEALTNYEEQMSTYGFEVVRAAALLGQQRMAQNPLPR